MHPGVTEGELWPVGRPKQRCEDVDGGGCAAGVGWVGPHTSTPPVRQLPHASLAMPRVGDLRTWTKNWGFNPPRGRAHSGFEPCWFCPEWQRYPDGRVSFHCWISNGLCKRPSLAVLVLCTWGNWGTGCVLGGKTQLNELSPSPGHSSSASDELPQFNNLLGPVFLLKKSLESSPAASFRN